MTFNLSKAMKELTITSKDIAKKGERGMLFLVIAVVPE